MSETYKAWIPTNNGQLSKSRVANSYSPDKWEIDNNILTLTETNTDDYTDTVFHDKEKKEFLLSYTLKINFSPADWEYTLDVDVGDSSAAIKSQGTIKSNGIIEFTYKSDIAGNQKNFPNTLFTIVKNCVHGNNHHDQKVDRFIPVRKKDTFQYSNIARRLADKIKKNEFEAKRLLADNTTNSHRLSVVNILSEQAKGFKSYYNTYCKIFEEKIEEESKEVGYLGVGYPDSVLLSIDSIRNKLEIEYTNSKFAITIFFSILAFALSANILIKPDSVPFFQNNHILLIQSILIIAVLIGVLIDFRYIGIIKNYLPSFSLSKEYLQRVFLYGEAVDKYERKIPKNKRKYYYMYLALEFGPYFLGTIFILLAIGGGYNAGKDIKWGNDNSLTQPIKDTKNEQGFNHSIVTQAIKNTMNKH